MIWSLLGTVAKGAVDVIKTKNETKKLMAEAEQTHIRKMVERGLEGKNGRTQKEEQKSCELKKEHVIDLYFA